MGIASTATACWSTFVKVRSFNVSNCLKLPGVGKAVGVHWHAYVLWCYSQAYCVAALSPGFPGTTVGFLWLQSLLFNTSPSILHTDASHFKALCQGEAEENLEGGDSYLISFQKRWTCGWKESPVMAEPLQDVTRVASKQVTKVIWRFVRVCVYWVVLWSCSRPYT